MTIPEIRQRASQCGLPLKTLCETAGIAASTMTRSTRSAEAGEANVSVRVLRKLNRALVDHEIALRDHLVALHPPGEQQQLEAAE